MAKYQLTQDIYMTEDLYAPEGFPVTKSNLVDERLAAANELKGWTPVIITHAKSLHTGDLEELDIQTHWLKTTELKEVN